MSTIEQITTEHPRVKVWTHGVKPLAAVNGQFGELHCIFKQPTGQHAGEYRLLRCFWMGDTVHVSVDKDGPAEALLTFLLEKLSYV